MSLALQTAPKKICGLAACFLTSYLLFSAASVGLGVVMQERNDNGSLFPQYYSSISPLSVTDPLSQPFGVPL